MSDQEKAKKVERYSVKDHWYDVSEVTFKFLKKNKNPRTKGANFDTSMAGSGEFMESAFSFLGWHNHILFGASNGPI